MLSQETRKTSNRQPNVTPKTTGKRTTTKKKSQNQQKKRNHKDQSRINEMEMKKKKSKD